MNNWPDSSLYVRPYGPVEVEGGLLFHFDQWQAAADCVERMKANGLNASGWQYPRDLGIYVQVG